jgi:hypothetical protein
MPPLNGYMRVGMPVPPKAVVELHAIHKGLWVSGWLSHLLPTPSRLSSCKELLFRVSNLHEASLSGKGLLGCTGLEQQMLPA